MDVDGLVAFVRFGMLHLFSPGELGFGDVKLGVLIGVAASMIKLASPVVVARGSRVRGNGYVATQTAGT